MLIKKLFNITATFNKTVFVKVMKLHLKSAVIIKKVLYAVKCSQITTIINDIYIDTLLNSDSQINLIE